MTRIAHVGITVRDRTYPLSTLLEGGGRYQASRYLEIGGDPATTAVATTTRLGVETDLIGHVGDDSYGNTLLIEFEGWGVNTAFCRRCPHTHSS